MYSQSSVMIFPTAAFLASAQVQKGPCSLAPQKAMDSSGSPIPAGSPDILKDKDKDSSYESLSSQSPAVQTPTGNDPLKEDDVELVPDFPVKHFLKQEP